MSTPINQHFVPKFYLKNFSETGKTINVFDKALEKSFQASVNSIASDKHFYNSEKSKTDLEKFYGSIEASISPIIKSLIERLKEGHLTSLPKSERSALAKYIWHQKTRSLESRVRMSHITNDLLSLANNTPKKELAELFSHKNVAQKDEHLNFLESNVANDAKSIDIFVKRTWVVFKNSTSIDYLTSDNPVVSYRHEEINHRAYEIAMPLTPKYLVAFVEKGTIPGFDRFDGKVVEIIDEQYIVFYNYLQVCQSTRQIFSMTPNFNTVISILKEDPSLKELNRQRFG
jgi:hypothetical protein